MDTWHDSADDPDLIACAPATVSMQDRVQGPTVRCRRKDQPWWDLSVLRVIRRRSSAFFEDLDVIERSLTFACPLVILGDVNIHLNAVNDPYIVRFQSMLDSYCLIH